MSVTDLFIVVFVGVIIATWVTVGDDKQEQYRCTGILPVPVIVSRVQLEQGGANIFVHTTDGRELFINREAIVTCEEML